MLFYLLSDKYIPQNSTVRLPANIVLFQELSAAVEQAEDTGHSEIYKVIVDIQIHDPLIFEQSRNIYQPMKNGRFADHSTNQGLLKFEFMERITDIESSRSIFQTLPILEQIEDIGFDAVFVFWNFQREVITIKECFGKIIGTATDEKL